MKFWWTVAAVCLAASPVYAVENVTEHALQLLQRYPLVDTHVDLPMSIRVLQRRPMEAIDKLGTEYPGHFDIPRAKQGGLGGVFLTANAPCPASIGQDPGPDFLGLTENVQQVLESMDLIHAMVERYPDRVQFAKSSQDIRQAFAEGKLATLIGLEGAHVLRNSLSTLRMFNKLGARYLTLTHVCHNAFASSNGGGLKPLEGVHEGNGLTNFGKSLVRELNRLGMMVDLSHTSDATALQALDVSLAPVVWTHSGSRSVNKHPRNIPEDILQKIASKPEEQKGIVLSVFYTNFIDPENPTVARVADHIEHIASIIGRDHVGLASDFDGIGSAVVGLEDVSKWPNIIEEMIRRGWTDEELQGLMGENLLRVMDKVDKVKEQLANVKPETAIYEKRTDLPAENWGGPNYAYLAPDIKEIVNRRRFRDEL